MTIFHDPSKEPGKGDVCKEQLMAASIDLRCEMLVFPLQAEVLGTTTDPMHFLSIDVKTQIMIPLPPHPGAFAVVRKNHTHEGVDLYCSEGAPVFAMESGSIVAMEDFTGPAAGSPWWYDTKSLLIEGASGVLCYGEITPESNVKVGDPVVAGQRIGTVQMVLRTDKGRPRSMLHLELHVAGTIKTTPWEHGHGRPESLRDPTDVLKKAASSYLF